MSTLRQHCTPQQLWAHFWLDCVRRGWDVDAVTIRDALYVLGETVQ